MTDQELIDRVAEKVMGWHRVRNGVVWIEPNNEVAAHREHSLDPSAVWNPLTSMDDVWMVAKKLDSMGFVVNCSVQGAALIWPKQEHEERLGSTSGDIEFQKDDTGRAICIAALRAVEKDV